MGFLAFLFGASKYDRAVPDRRPLLRGVGGRPVIQVPRNTQQLFEERGWTLRGRALKGYYRTRFGAFKGRIEKALSRPVFYIIDPPRELLHGDHSACFTEVRREEFRIHWSCKPIDCNMGILFMERCITEALT